MMHVVILGGVAAGAAIATRLRRLDENLEITVIEQGSHPSFANCALPYYLGGEVHERNALFAASPEYLRGFFKLDLRLETRAVGLKPASHEVELEDKDGQRSSLHYDALVIATGTSTVLPDFAARSDHVFPLKNIPDTDAVFGRIAKDRHVLVVGGGAVGLECCENLRKRGCHVTLCESASHVLASFDPEMASYAHAELSALEVRLLLNTRVEDLKDEGEGVRASLGGGRTELYDFVIWCAGNRPNTGFASEASLECDERGYLKTDKFMRTSDRDIYALGDCALVKNLVSGLMCSSALATPISKEVRAAAGMITGTALHPFPGTLGTAAVRCGSMTLASTGLSEEQCQSLGIKDAVCVYTHPMSHPGFYPKAQRVHVKLLFRLADGKIYGAQACGIDGADKTVEAISSVMGLGGSVHDLVERDQAYAPPFTAVRDAAGMTAAVAQNACDGLFTPVSYRDLKNYENAFKLDVRPAKSFEAAHPEGFVNIPAGQLRERLEEIPHDRPVLISCMVGQNAYVSARILKGHGFKDIYVLTGALLTLGAAGFGLAGSKK